MSEETPNEQPIPAGRTIPAGRPVQAQRSRRSGSIAAQKWSRIIHVYTSMIALLTVLFFSITGITLNHPDWTFGGRIERTTIEGTLPDGWDADNEIDWLVVSEHFRKAHGVRGLVSEKDGDPTDGSITFKGAAYQADAFFSEDGSYELTVETQGAMAVLNDLHKGRDTGSSWRWLIDVAGIVLTIVSLTGLFLQFFLRKRRKAALASATVGAAVLGFLGWLALQ
jgi:uncharacterized protein